jgi:hypothetical protein
MNWSQEGLKVIGILQAKFNKLFGGNWVQLYKFYHFLNQYSAEVKGSTMLEAMLDTESSNSDLDIYIKDKVFLNSSVSPIRQFCETVLKDSTLVPTKLNSTVDTTWDYSKYANVTGIHSVYTIDFKGKQIQFIIVSKGYLLDVCSDFAATTSKFCVINDVLKLKLKDYDNVQKRVLTINPTLISRYEKMTEKRRKIQNERFAKYRSRGFVFYEDNPSFTEFANSFGN